MSVALLELRGADGLPVERIVPQPVGSKFQDSRIIHDIHLARFFEDAFSTYVKMKDTHTPWRRLAGECGALEDAPYLEQKFASLMMALEYFMRNSLLECGRLAPEVSKWDFSELVGACRRDLKWVVPRHYTSRDLIRLQRNAVMHGDELKTKDSGEFRLLFDKWRLFLFRRILMRLGYSGKVVSPERGWASLSDVDDFSEEHNSFAPAHANIPDPRSEFRSQLRKFSGGTAARTPPPKA